MKNFKQCVLLLALLLFGTTLIAEAGKYLETTAKSRRRSRSSKKKSKIVEYPPTLAVFCDIGDDELGFINTATDELIQVPYHDIVGWPFTAGDVAYTQHTAIDATGETIFVSTISNGEGVSASVIIVTYDEIDWDEGEVSGLRVSKVARYRDADNLSQFDYSIEGTASQPIPSWASPKYSQLHGPSFRPGCSPNSIYWGTWTDSDFIVINTKSGGITTEQYDEARYSHGFFFNPSGDKAIGPNYWFDRAFVGLYSFRGGSITPSDVQEIYLDNGDGTYGAFSHYATWWDDRFAYVATMQQGLTWPGIYLIDAVDKKATMVAGTAQNKEKEGVWNSASDAIIANGKLYVSEEETLNATGDTQGVGSVGIWSIEADMSLTWIKRLYSDQSGDSKDGMPQGFGGSHGSIVAMVGTNEYVFVCSLSSNHIIKIDTEADVVAKYWDSTDGLSVPHGAFAAGSYR